MVTKPFFEFDNSNKCFQCHYIHTCADLKVFLTQFLQFILVIDSSLTNAKRSMFKVVIFRHSTNSYK